jgi:hypothetical protein
MRRRTKEIHMKELQILLEEIIVLLEWGESCIFPLTQALQT